MQNSAFILLDLYQNVSWVSNMIILIRKQDINMNQTTTYLEFKTDLFANTFFDVIKKYHDYEVYCEGKL